MPHESQAIIMCTSRCPNNECLTFFDPEVKIIGARTVFKHNTFAFVATLSAGTYRENLVPPDTCVDYYRMPSEGSTEISLDANKIFIAFNNLIGTPW